MPQDFCSNPVKVNCSQYTRIIIVPPVQMITKPRSLMLGLLLLFPGISFAASFTDPLMQGQDPEVEFRSGLFNLVQSDGCNIWLRESATMGGLVTPVVNQIILSPGCSNVWAPEIHWFT